MPAYTLGEIMSFATSDMGRRADIAQSDASRLANEAYFEVFYACDPQEGEKIAVSSTTTGENKIELPTDFNIPITATLIYQPSWSTASSAHSSYITLHKVSIEEVDSKNPQPSGVPKEIAFFNSWAELYPSPNSSYSFQVRYRAHPEDLISTSSVPSLSTEWRKAVQIKAKQNVAAFIQDAAGVESARLEYLDYVRSIRNTQAKRQHGEFRQHFAPVLSKGGRRRV